MREALEAIPPLNVFRMLAHAPTLLRPFLRFGGAILGQTELDAGLRELAILEVARVTGARYEWVQHVPIARQAGVSEQAIEAVERGEHEHASLDPAARAVLDFTEQVTRQAQACPAALERLREHLSPREVVELLLTAGSYRMLAGLMLTLELELDEPAGNAVIDSSRRPPRSSRRPPGSSRDPQRSSRRPPGSSRGPRGSGG